MSLYKWLAGLRPVRTARFKDLKVPKPTGVTVSPFSAAECEATGHDATKRTGLCGRFVGTFWQVEMPDCARGGLSGVIDFLHELQQASDSIFYCAAGADS